MCPFCRFCWRSCLGDRFIADCIHLLHELLNTCLSRVIDHRGLLTREIDTCFLDAWHLFQALFKAHGAGSARHPFDLENGTCLALLLCLCRWCRGNSQRCRLVPDRIHLLYHRLHICLGWIICNHGLFGRQIDARLLDAWHLFQSLLDTHGAGSACHAFKGKGGTAGPRFLYFSAGGSSLYGICGFCCHQIHLSFYVYTHTHPVWVHSDYSPRCRDLSTEELEEDLAFTACLCSLSCCDTLHLYPYPAGRGIRKEHADAS